MLYYTFMKTCINYERKFFMYCNQCGNELDEKGYCQTCNRYTPKGSPKNKTFIQKPLYTCSWFAPVAVVLSYLFSTFITGNLLNLLSYNYFLNFLEPGTADSVFYSMISSILYLTPMLITFVLSIIAISNQPAKLKKFAIVSFAIPVLTVSFMNITISNVLPYILTYVSQLLNFFSNRSAHYVYHFAHLLSDIIACLIGAVLSYLLVKKYFENVQKYFYEKA